MTLRPDILESATGHRYRKSFAWFPVNCNDGKWRWLSVLRFEEARIGRGWYRIGVSPVAVP